MYTTYKLTIAAVKMFLRNRQALFFTLFMPFFIMIIFGYIGFDKPQKIDLGLVVENPTAETQQFIDQITKFETFNITRGTLEEEKHQLSEGNRSIVLDVPSDFMNISTPRTTNCIVAPCAGTAEAAPIPRAIIAYTNEGQAPQAQTVISVLNQFLDKTTLRVANAPTLFDIKEISVDSRNLRYIEFLLPGLVAMSVMQMAVFSVAFVFTQYKEKGVLKRLAATPMQPWQFVSANAVTRLIISVFQAAIFVGMGLLLFKIHIQGSYGVLLLCVVLGALMFLGLGFTISGLAKTVDSVPVFSNLIVFPMLFLGGTFFPISGMPAWLQSVAKFLPLTYLSTSMRDVMTKGSTLWDIRGDLLGMIIWAVILITLATITFTFQEKESA